VNNEHCGSVPAAVNVGVPKLEKRVFSNDTVKS